MTDDRADSNRVFFRSDTLSTLVAQSLVAAAALFGADALGHLRLRPLEFILVLVVFIGSRVAATACSVRFRGRRLFGWLTAGALPVLLLLLINARFHHPLTLLRLGYLWAFVTLAQTAWNGWRVPQGIGVLGEQARRTLVFLAAVWAVFPFFNDRLSGGVDSRWYAMMLADFIEQLHRGKFLVFVGQTPFAFNGGVHPFRSAPLYMWTAGIWDLVTLRELNIPALQHLSAITASLLGALGMYVGLLKVVAGKRWFAALAAVIYILSPAVLAPLYCADMYMTFMALAALPWVFCGNARFLIQKDEEGGRMLACGLVFTWMAHPPTAMEASLATLLLQVTGWVCSDESLASVMKRGMSAALWFLGLGAYYFGSMSELPPQPGASVRLDLVMIVGLCLAWTAAGRGLILRRWGWTVLIIPAAVILLRLNPAWLFWLLVVSILCFVAGFIFRRHPEPRRLCWAPSLLIGSAVVAAAFGWYAAQRWHFTADAATLAGLNLYNAQWSRFFLPLSKSVLTNWDFQLGYALLFLVGLGLVAGTGRSRPVAIAAGVSPLILLLMIRLPAVSDFFVGYPPLGIAQIINLPLPHRIFPVAAACSAISGYVALVVLPRSVRPVAAFCLALLVAWSAWQSWNFVRRGFSIVQPRDRSEIAFRSENAAMDRFAYDLLPIPGYYSHGKMDPRLETRLLDPDLQVRVGPDQIALIMEKSGREEMHLRMESHNGAIEWVRLDPGLTVEPGENVLLRFIFDPKIEYGGYFVATTPFWNYREYAMPSSGYPFAFGVGLEESKVLSFWNTTNLTANYTFAHLLKPVNNLAPDGRVYATVVKSHYMEEASPIRMESWLPYRVRVQATETGFVETPRVFLPGYAAKVDGRSVRPQISREHLIMVPITPGDHMIELEFVGTRRLWFALLVSAIAFLAFIRACLRDRGDGEAAAMPLELGICAD